MGTRQTLKRELELSGPIVLALGRMASNKGYDLLVRSMVPVFQRVPEAKLLLAIGATNPTDDERGQIDALKALAAELGFAERVLFRDYIPDDQLADYYRAADVFALSSRYEPFGMTAIEAMACGTPTVITTEGGLWEQVTWGLEALYANPNDTDAFGHAILEILQYPQVSGQLARFGSQKARSHFTWTGISQQILSLVEAEVHQPRGGLPVRQRAAASADALLAGV
jgi:mannosylfructose-phosphate synthase